jgi:uncharacterized membrane protein
VVRCGLEKEANMSGWFLFGAAFLASGVEMVEALTIILATGITRGWRSSLIGAACGVVVLAIIILVFGAALTVYVPLDALRLVIGTFLLLFGLTWLRKAILRYAGIIAMHDEDAIYARTVAALGTGTPVAARQGIDWTGWTVAFKGVLLEGIEVAFIVITFGTSAGSEGLGGIGGVELASLGALAALLLVGAAGIALHRPLALVPENTMKFAVGLMLTSFGTFWAAEGVGVDWPLADLTIVGLLVGYGIAAAGAIVALRKAPVEGEAVAA